MEAIESNHTWHLEDLPTGHRAIGLNWVYKLKKNSAGEIIKHKARLMAKGYINSRGWTLMKCSHRWHGWNPFACCWRSLHKRVGRFITWM